MKFSFKANIYKVGIHPCMYVPLHTAAAITAQKGYIPVSRKIDNQSFLQTLLPVKNNTYRLYMNGAMLKGSGLQVGDTASFTTEQKLVPALEPTFVAR